MTDFVRVKGLVCRMSSEEIEMTDLVRVKVLKK